MNRAVFLDRDGVINAMVETSTGIDSPQRVDDFRLLEGVAPAIREFRELGFSVVVVSNQPGIAKGKSTPEQLSAVHDRMHAALAEEGAVLDGVYYCLHHPQASLPEYRVTCDCRKPRPGLLHLAARELRLSLEGSYMVGDQATDMVAGKHAGCTTVLVPAHDGLVTPPTETDHVCDGLPGVAALVARLEATDPLKTAVVTRAASPAPEVRDADLR